MSSHRELESNNPSEVAARQRSKEEAAPLVESGKKQPCTLPQAPAERALRGLELRNIRAGNENAGFLSAARGFLPRTAPLTRLDKRFSAWDELAAELPELYRSLTLRRRVESLPMLDASADSLDPRELLRAASLLSILAHAYWYVDSRPPDALPEVIRKPWAEVRARLGRRQEVISYIDLIVYNWRVRNPSLAEPLVVENMDLLFPTVGNQEERVFYLTQVEILARTVPIVRLTAAAQGAVLRRDDEELEAALAGIISCLGRLVGSSLPKINPNPYSNTYVDPVIWAKTVAPFAVPIHRGDQGPSGTSSPVFNTLDIFFGRRDFASFLGREITQLRATYPQSWRTFLGALGQVSVARYVEQRESRALLGAFQEALELYAADTGFLGRHRMKVYGFLELAFKVGRSVTIGGFGGVFTDRTWDVVDDELTQAQSERTSRLANLVHRAKVRSIDPAVDDPACGVRRVVLDIARCGVRYRSGDRCLILPENEPEVVERTLRALAVDGDERVRLTEEWKAHAKQRAELEGKTQIPVRDLLRFGAIRPVSPRLAEALHARTQSCLLYEAIERGVTERWELWELLELLRAHGFAPDDLWRRPSTGALREDFGRLIPPQRFRVYSVSSAPRSPLRKAEGCLELTVGQLRYPAAQAPVERVGCPHAAAQPDLRCGTASTFLTRALERGLEVPFRIEHPEVFRLPDDPATPIVMFAGGSGVAPFRAFVEERARSSRSAPALMFLSVRSPEDFLYADEFAPALVSGALKLSVAFTRRGACLGVGPGGRIALTQGPERRITDLMLEPEAAAQLYHLAQPSEAGGGGAVFYVCGRGGFADSVLRTLKAILRSHDPEGESDERAARTLHQMVGDRRLVQEIHTDAQPVDDDPPLFDVSEIASHNDAENGYWIVVDRVVYDVTEFIELHPGGRRVIQAYAGMDATHGYARAHYGRADVDAMREIYRIGMVRTPCFDGHLVEVEGKEGVHLVDCSAAYRAFAKALQLVVEMQNALNADQSLYTEAAEQAPFTLLRAVETHRRFLKNYFAVLLNETLPELWCVAQGLFFPEQPADWMARFTGELARSDAARATEALAQQAFEDFEACGASGRLPELVAAFTAGDAWLLRAMKAILQCALRELERHGAHVRERGATRIRRACHVAASLARRYYRRAGQGASPAAADSVGLVGLSTSARPCEAHRLHTGTHWVFEEYASQSLAVLRRTPAPVSSLAALAHENERVLTCLKLRHREFGLVVDTRQARLRNDSGFEDVMAKMRRELTCHFKRTAILLESSIGELQVSRIERDERRYAIATRSESTAFKFAQRGQWP